MLDENGCLPSTHLVISRRRSCWLTRYKKHKKQRYNKGCTQPAPQLSAHEAHEISCRDAERYMPAALERRAGCRLPAQPPWQQCRPAVRLRPPEAPSGYAPSAPPPAASRTPERSTPTHSSALSGAAKAEHAGSQHLARSRKCLDTRGWPCRQSTVDPVRSYAYDAGMEQHVPPCN